MNTPRKRTSNRHFTIARVASAEAAAETTAFLLQPELFGTPPTPGERAEFLAGPADFASPGHVYWCVRHERGCVIGAAGIRMHSFNSGIFEIAALAVGVEWRRQGLGRRLLELVLDDIAAAVGRGLIFDTSSDPSYLPMHRLLECLGFRMVGHFPDFYCPGEDTLWYFHPI